MDKKICCFAGHGNLNYKDELKNLIYNKCIELITVNYVREFWVGNYGNFDTMAANIVRELKHEYPEIELNLIIPYLTAEINNYKEYDNIIMVDIPLNTPKRYWILKSNQYMINQSNYLVAYVNYSFGGAVKTLEYAKRRKHIVIFNFGNYKN